MIVVDGTFKLRRDVAADWVRKNPILAEGEPGYEVDTGQLRIGNGFHTWLQLEPFFPGRPLSSGGGASDEAVWAHINSLNPHPAYDDGPSFLLLYQNAKV